jgi:DNA-binding Lrp family transcriptional regulator
MRNNKPRSNKRAAYAGVERRTQRMKCQAYVFVDTRNPGPKRIVGEVRKISGVVRADALFGVPDIIALVEGGDIAAIDAVIDQIAELDGVLDTESKVVRWV